jgi:hypothetical protein
MSDGVDRRSFLAGGATSIAALSTMSALTASAAAQGLERPNFMWYVAEDLNPYVGAYGDATARTPNIDRLAREGVRFETAYSASPVCAPPGSRC